MSKPIYIIGMGINGSKEHCLDIAKLLRQAKKKAVKTALFEYLIELGLLHAHSTYFTQCYTPLLREFHELIFLEI